MKIIRSVSRVLVAALLLQVGAAVFTDGNAFAATYFSRQTGDWNVNTTWSTASCGGAAVGVGVFPVAGDAVQICNLGAAHTVTVTANATAASLAINQGNQNSTLAINGGVTLNITGNAVATGNTNLVNKLISVGANGTFSVGGNLALVTGTQTKNAELRLADGATTTVTVGGYFAGTAAGGAFNVRALITFLGQGTLNVGGNLASGATLAGGTGTINFNGGAAQTIGTYTTYNNIRIGNTAGGVTLTGTTTFGGTLQVQTGTFTVGAFALTVTGATTVASTMALTSSTGAKNFNGTVAVQNGGVLDLQASSPTFGNTVTVQNGGTLQLTTSVTGTKTFNGAVVIDSGGTWNNTINEGVTLAAGLTNNGTFTAGNGAYVLTGSLTNGNVFNAGTGTFSLTGDFTNNGTFNSSTGTFTFNGGAAQSITGTSSGTTSFANLTLANANGLSISGTHDVTVSTLLTLTTGSIATGANVLFISNGSNVASAGGADFVVGNLRKAVATGTPTTVFEIGTGTSYTPVTLVFASVTTAGNLTAATTATDHPDVANSGLDNTMSVNRYWTFANAGVVFTTYSATFTFVAGDVDGGADTTTFEVSRFSPPYPAAGTWSGATVGTRTATTTQITGATGFGNFAIGQPLAAAGGIGRFNAYDTTTAAGAVTGKIMTKIAGAAFNVDVIAIVNNRKSINAGFTGTVRVELLNASDNSGTLDTATGCNTSWTVIQTITPDPVFVGADNGRRTITVTENNSWREARFRIQNFPAATLTGCSTDAFAIRPNTLASLAVNDNDWETAGTGRTLDDVAFVAPGSGGKVHKAGRPFSVRATAVNGAGSPATTTNYTGAPTATVTACVGAACTSTFGTLSLTTTFAAGVLAPDTATYTDVGSFNLQLVDTSFAVIDATDGSPADCSATGRYVCSATIAVGRFVPDHFAVSLVAPTFGTACSGFTYLGQALNYTVQPVINVTAERFGGGTIASYTGAWWRITNTDITPSTQALRYTAATGTLDVAGLPAVASDPAIVDLGGGAGMLTFASGTGLRFSRAALIAPFDADISVAVNVIDGDGVAHASNPARFGQATAGNGISFSAGKPMRFGRLVIRNVSGSQLVPQVVSLETQYWAYTNPPTNTVLGFVTHTADSCTAIAASDVALDGYTGSLGPAPNCKTAISGGGLFSSGRKSLLLAASGSGNNGSANLTVNLGSSASGNTCTAVGVAPGLATTTDLPHLQGQWDGVDQGSDALLYDDNPAARATFGIYRGSDEVIFIRESF